MKCDFCNQEFPAEELETIKGALHEYGDVRGVDRRAMRKKIELLQKMQQLNN